MDEEHRVGVRELRQNLSVYLRRVAAGESLEVTDHGKPVALLVPVPSPSKIDQLIAAGKIIPASRPWSERLPPLPPVAPGEKTLSEILREMRDEERY